MQQEEENPGSFSGLDWRDNNYKKPANNKFTASYEEDDDEG